MTVQGTIKYFHITTQKQEKNENRITIQGIYFLNFFEQV